MKFKSDVFFSLIYLLAIFLLGMFVYRGENIVAHLYWTRLVIFILMGICAIFDIGVFVSKVLIKGMKSNWASNVEVLIRTAYIVLFIVNAVV